MKKQLLILISIPLLIVSYLSLTFAIITVDRNNYLFENNNHTSELKSINQINTQEDGHEYLVKNYCDERIYVLVNYEDLEGNRITDGWINIDPGEEKFIAYTKSHKVYVYAESSTKTWCKQEPNENIRRNNRYTFDGKTYTFYYRPVIVEDSNYWYTWSTAINCTSTCISLRNSQKKTSSGGEWH